MATFKTHFFTATVISGTLAGGLLTAHLASPKAAFFYTVLGTLGGILPDLDSPRSIPARLFFALASLSIATLVWASQRQLLTAAPLLLLSTVVYFSAYYSLYHLFAKFSTHRGNFHSILAAFCVGFAVTASLYQTLAIPERMAWLSGGFVTAGYLLHLTLDEIYSVDLKGRKLKKSFGSALKIVSLKYKISTLLLTLATIGCFLLTPYHLYLK